MATQIGRSPALLCRSGGHFRFYCVKTINFFYLLQWLLFWKGVGSFYVARRVGLSALHTTTTTYVSVIIPGIVRVQRKLYCFAAWTTNERHEEHNTTEEREESVFVSPPNLLLRYLRARPPATVNAELQPRYII